MKMAVVLFDNLIYISMMKLMKMGGKWCNIEKLRYSCITHGASIIVPGRLLVTYNIQ